MHNRITGIILASSLLVSVSFTSASTIKQTTDQSQFLFKADPVTKNLHMLTGKQGSMAFTKQVDESTADAVKRTFAPYFGINNPASELMVTKDFSHADNRQTIRYQQLHNGVPVIGGELVANLKNQKVTAMSGETSTVNLANLEPAISAAQAQATAIAAVSKWHTIDAANLNASEPQLSIYDPKLIGPDNGPQQLVWQVTVTPAQLAPVNEYVLVEAQTNVIVLHFNQVDSALDLATYTANSTSTLPGTLVCDETQPNCTNGTDLDADYAHEYAADTYDFYNSEYGRDGIDGAGSTIISTVDWTDGNSCPNAYWNGSQMVYCDTMSRADDVVAHELTHGVTNNTSNLFYYYQSGAINESLSDVWGEFVDLTNGKGDDSAGVRWLLGEDLPGIGAVRDMADPTTFGDPDRMTSANYYTGALDSGGVHSNSGINNKAVSLMVDGGSFNGQNVTGLGITKTAALYYDVQTNYLTSGSDYLDLYNALNASCTALIGVKGITSSDCTQVNNALLAVEMNQQPVADFNPEALVCGPGQINEDLFHDDFATNLSNWTATINVESTAVWATASGYSTSDTLVAYGPGSSTLLEGILTQNNQVAIPGAGYYLHFTHVFDYEVTAGINYDGGIIEYSTDNGATWNDAMSLFDSGRNYTGSIDASSDNLHAGENAFISTSHGYNSTRLDLTSLAGQSVRFRFINTGDSLLASPIGWAIDDFRIYTCITNSPPSSNAGSDQDVLAGASVSLSGSGNDPDTDSITYQWTQISGPTVSLSGATTTTPSFIAPATSSTLVFRIRVTDSYDQYSDDTVTVTVNAPPTANAGIDQTVNVDSAVNLSGSGNDPEAGALTYAWTQTGGTSVSLTGAATATPSFTAPSAATTLSFQLTVTDDHGQSDVDSVTVTVQDPNAGGGGGGGCTLSENGRFDPIWLSLLLFFAGLHLLRRRRLKADSQ